MSADFSLEEYWKEVLEEVSGKVSAISFDVWIKTLKPKYAKGNVLVLSSPSNSSKDLVLKNYKTIICDALAKTNRGFYSIDVVVEDHDEKPQVAPEEQKKQIIESTPFNPKYTFDNFVVGSSNKFAYASAHAVAENPGKSYNPLFIYGGVGLGKTHLLHAIGNELLEKRPELKVIYTTTEQFTNELIESLTNRKSSESDFRNRYRSADVLIVDDIQFIISKTSTQEEFFHTFNELIQHGKQVIISSDKPPKEINPLEERLRSRFEWGLLSDIGFPDLETRIAILNKKAQIERYNVKREVIEFIAGKVKNNIREMEGFLSRTVFYASLQGKLQVSLEDAEEALKNQISEEDTKSEDADMEAIIDAVSRYFNISKADLFSKKRLKEIVEARQICMYLACEYSRKYPLSYIGERFGKDHSTVIHAREKIKADMKKDKRLKIQVDDIRNLVKGN